MIRRVLVTALTAISLLFLPNVSSASETECFTGNSEYDDYCKTQLAFKLAIATGADFDALSFVIWGEYMLKIPENYTNECYLEFDDLKLIGIYKAMKFTGGATSDLDREMLGTNKDYASWAGCHIKYPDSMKIVKSLLKETRYTYQSKRESESQSFYTSEIISENEQHTLLDKIKSHSDVSAKRTRFVYKDMEEDAGGLSSAVRKFKNFFNIE